MSSCRATNANLPASEPNRVPVWAGAPGCPDSYRTNDFLTGEPRTIIVWGRGAAERWNADLMGLADPSDFAQVQDRTFPAGVTDRNGNLMDSDCWVCTMVGSPDVESNLDEDDAVLGYCNAAGRGGMAQARRSARREGWWGVSRDPIGVVESVRTVEGETIATVRLGAPTDADVEHLRRAMVEAWQTHVAIGALPNRCVEYAVIRQEMDASQDAFVKAGAAYLAAKRARGGT